MTLADNKLLSLYQMDWDPTTVEGYDESRNEVIMIFNFDLSAEAQTWDVISYVTGRIVACCQNYPKGVSILVKFDVRGQAIDVNATEGISDRFFELLSNLKISDQVFITFVR